MIAVSESRAIGSLVGSRRQTNTIPLKAKTLHRSQRQLVNSSQDFVLRGTSDFAYMGEIAIPNFRKSQFSQNVPSEDDSIIFFDNNFDKIRNGPPSTTTTSTTERSRDRRPNACQLRCHTRITNEYNPRCGSDGITYYNPGKLDCAKRCGKGKFIYLLISCASANKVPSRLKTLIMVTSIKDSRRLLSIL